MKIDMPFNQETNPIKVQMYEASSPTRILYIHIHLLPQLLLTKVRLSYMHGNIGEGALFMHALSKIKTP